MEFSNDSWRKIIIKHFKNPQYQGFIEHKDAIIYHQPNLNCSDHLDLQLVIENQKITVARFKGMACILAIASADIVCHHIINKSIDETIKFLKLFQAMLNNETYDKQLLKDLSIFLYSKDQVARQQCILLATNGFLAMLEKKC